MGLMDKIKGFFYDEEEIEEEVKIPVKRELPKKKPIVFEEEEKKEVPERELFRSERTFNFPMDMDDEPDFTPIKKSIKEEKIVNNITESSKQSYSPNTNKATSYRSYSAIKPQSTEPKEEKKFKPTPIISPIYGIMEGEIKPKEEQKEFLFNEKKDLSITKRIDFDTVRQKAYGSTKSDYIEKTEEELEENENKGIFFNLVDDKEEKMLENEDIKISKSFEEDEDDDIKITYNDVDYDEESTEDDEDDEIEIPKIARSRTKRKVTEEENEEDAILSETKEQDLFNLIDNMYNSDDEEDDE